jgi:MFS family permease
LSGLAFSLSKSVFGVLAGNIIDKYNRKRLIIAASIGWSICTLITGSVNSLLVLGIMRFLLGMF